MKGEMYLQKPTSYEYTCSIDNWEVSIALNKETLNIRIIQNVDGKHFKAAYTFDALPPIEKNTLNDFDSIQSFTEELIEAAKEKKMKIFPNGEIFITYDILARKGKSKVVRQFLLPTKEEKLSELQNFTRTLQKIKQEKQVLETSMKQQFDQFHQKFEKLERQISVKEDSPEGKFEECIDEIQKLSKLLREQIQERKKQTTLMNQKIESLEELVNEERNIKKEQLYLQNEEFKREMSEKIKSFEKIVHQEIIQRKRQSRILSQIEVEVEMEKKPVDKYGQRFIFAVNKKHQAIQNFTIQDNKIAKTVTSGNFKFVSQTHLPMTGVSYFQIRPITAYNMFIFFGLVEESEKNLPSYSDSKLEIAYEGYTPSFRNNGEEIDATRSLKIGQVLTIILDNSTHAVSWVINDDKIAEIKLGEHLWGKKMYAFISMGWENDCVELVNS